MDKQVFYPSLLKTMKNYILPWNNRCLLKRLTVFDGEKKRNEKNNLEIRIIFNWIIWFEKKDRKMRKRFLSVKKKAYQKNRLIFLIFKR